MSVEENKAIARRFIEAANGVMGSPEKIPAYIEEFFSPEFVCHFLTNDLNIDQFREFENEVSTAFPDMNHTIDNIITEGEMVVILRTSTGTHKEAFQGITPTGKRIDFKAVDICRVAEGKFAEMWVYFDNLIIMQQLGVIPTN